MECETANFTNWAPGRFADLRDYVQRETQQAARVHKEGVLTRKNNGTCVAHRLNTFMRCAFGGIYLTNPMWPDSTGDV